MENRVSELSPGNSPACVSCSLWKSGRRHKTLEERLIAFYGHLPTLEEMESSRPRIISWGDEPVEGGKISWGSPVGNEVW